MYFICIYILNLHQNVNNLFDFFICIIIITFLGKKYCAMLNEENGVDILQTITLNKSVDREVCELCYNILDLLYKFR